MLNDKSFDDRTDSEVVVESGRGPAALTFDSCVAAASPDDDDDVGKL
jgi:hypothetical protein